MQQSYEQLIIEGIKGLPQEVLAEITDFVYFVRNRTIKKEANKDWLNLAGTITKGDLQLMAEAIEAGCEGA